MEKETVILTCSSLERYVKRAQEKMHTNYPIIVIDRIYHVEPATMKTVILAGTGKKKKEAGYDSGCHGILRRSLGPGAGTGKDCDSKSR